MMCHMKNKRKRINEATLEYNNAEAGRQLTSTCDNSRQKGVKLKESDERILQDSSNIERNSHKRSAFEGGVHTDGPVFLRKGVDIKKHELMDDIGCRTWFQPGYSLPSNLDTSTPTMSLKVAKIVDVGQKRVYDLSVPGNEAFFANSVAVHNCIDLVGRIADRGAEFVAAREWMRICFELLEMLKAHKKAIRRAAVNTFGYIAKAIGPQDVLHTLLNNLKVQERQNRVCTTVAIGESTA